MATLTAKDGFDFGRLVWSRPDGPMPELCSYCFAPAVATEDEVPLIIWKEDGHTAIFCRVCQAEWFGMTSFDGENEDWSGPGEEGDADGD